MISSIKSYFTCKKPLFRIPDFFIIALLALMAACTPAITNVCPPVQVYTPQFSEKLAIELEKLPEGNPIIRVMADYINLRDQNKLCRST